MYDWIAHYDSVEAANHDMPSIKIEKCGWYIGKRDFLLVGCKDDTGITTYHGKPGDEDEVVVMGFDGRIEDSPFGQFIPTQRDDR